MISVPAQIGNTEHNLRRTSDRIRIFSSAKQEFWARLANYQKGLVEPFPGLSANR